MSGEMRRGAALGLWILAGLAFLLAALFPLSAGAGIAGPALLALAAGWTAIATSGGERKRESLEASFPLSRPAPRSPRGEVGSPTLALAGAVFALAIALTIVRDGDRRSFWYVAGVALVALAIARGR